MRRLGVLALLLLSGCESSQKFDLVCNGKLVEPFMAGALPMTREIGKHAMRFSVDLEAEKWCYTEGCNAAMLIPIQSVTDATLELNTRTTVDRTSGYVDHTLGSTQFIGTCTKARFTKLPATAF